MNFLVYCPRGAMFLKSIDTSGLTKDAETLFNIFDSCVQEIGVEYIVQLITDNASAYKKAGKKLQQKYGTLFWSPCAAHCIDLMLENIANPRWFPLVDENIVNVSEPLVRVLRLVDGDEKPAMGYLYEAMDKAKEEIKRRLKNKVSFSKRVAKHSNEVDSDPDIQDKISSQLDEYKKSIGDFGTSLAIRQRERLNPVSWWEQFGLGTPDLQSFAIRVLSQCCSATGCERNWSTFEYVHSKKRNRLEHKRVNDLVFVHYNLRLRERNIQRNKYALDPISLDNIDLMGDWVAEEPALLNPDDINWDCLNEPVGMVNVEEDAELETIDVDDDDDDEHGLTNLAMGAGSSCGSSFDDEFDPSLMDDDEEE
ncbi:uncharacterized protein LOC111990224 [Quercus suber]|uniref:uncharacterized protein LOC111990224 n=1 Tax=Quercus suber TaxID=58331 RepID=UPI0032DFF066